MAVLGQITQNQVQKENALNRNFRAVAPAGIFSWRGGNGLVYNYYGNDYPNATGVRGTVADGSLALTASTTNYVVYNTTTGVLGVILTVPVAPNAWVATCVTNATGLASDPVDKRIFPLMPEGVSPSLAGSGSGGASLMTDKGDWDVVSITGLQVVLKGAQAYMSLPLEYTSTFVQSLSSNSTVTLPANSTGFIVQTTGGPVQSMTSISANANVIGFLYSYTTNSTNVTRLVDCSRSNFTRVLGICYETSIAVTGNLSKANTFTAPYSYQGYQSNLSTAFRYEAYIKCLTAEFGYVVGDLVTNFLTGPVGAASNCYPATVQIQSGSGNGNVAKIILDGAIKAQRLDSSIGTVVDLTPANWQLRIRIYPLR